MTLLEHILYLVRWAPTAIWFLFAFILVAANIAIALIR